MLKNKLVQMYGVISNNFGVVSLLKALCATFYTLIYLKSSMSYANISTHKTPSVFVDLSILFTLLSRQRVTVSDIFP